MNLSGREVDVDLSVGLVHVLRKVFLLNKYYMLVRAAHSALRFFFFWDSFRLLSWEDSVVE